jgi:Outer membrane protein
MNIFGHIKVIVALGISLFVTDWLMAQETLKITLDQALEIALSQSNTVKIADMTVEKAGYAQKGSYASLYPNVNIAGSYQRTLKKQVMAMEIGGVQQTFAIGQSNNVNAGVSASMPLVNAQLWESLNVSAMNVELAVEQARSSKISMISQVKQAFYGVLFAKESLEVVTQVYDNASKNYDETMKKYNVGKASEFEMLRSQVTVMNAEPNVSSAQNAVVLTTWQLKALLGINLDTEVEVVGSLSDYTDMILTPYTNTTDVTNNSSLQQLDIQRRQLESTIKMQKFQYIPTLSASFGYNYVAMGDDFDMNWNPFSSAALSLNIPIFDGFSKHNTIMQSKKSKDMLDLQMEDVRRNVLISIRNYNDKIALSIKNYAAAKMAVDVAQKSYNISEKMYEVGKATLVELNDAQVALTQAQLTLNQAIYNYMVAKASLDELLGKEMN